ncbi:MAG: Xanthosine triphosphate pyrophosphatase [Parcubacteria group bacterium Gr01-1014_46]|nr:MAG: Xanthosine triphosphate pyrophosphatase [Parcubacteria group bacterium Gr01-1014_46]
MKILLATTNGGKIERFKNLLKQVDETIEGLTPTELNIKALEIVEDGKTLLDNAKLKAQAYFGKVDIPILSNDTGFYVEGEGFVDAPKRKALGETDENSLTNEELSKVLLDFWKGVATKHGGKVNATWIEAFVILFPNGEIKEAESRREILLTDQEFGVPHYQMPVRALYYSKATNKPAIQHTHEEEIIEMKPVVDALSKVLGY